MSLIFPAFHDAGTAFGFAPEAVDVFYVGADAAEGEFEEALPLGGFEEDALFLREPMTDGPAADLCFRRQAVSQFLDVVFAGSRHGYFELGVFIAMEVE